MAKSRSCSKRCNHLRWWPFVVATVDSTVLSRMTAEVFVADEDEEEDDDFSEMDTLRELNCLFSTATCAEKDCEGLMRVSIKSSTIIRDVIMLIGGSVTILIVDR